MGPLTLFGEGMIPSIRTAGAFSDGGQNCSSCHSSFGAANSDARGSLTATLTDYNPGVLQMIKVTVQHPMASRWGFQMTVRAVSDETQQAGTFVASDTVQVRCDDGSKFGSAAPCGGSREFAEHVDAPRTAIGAGFEWTVMWMPPINEVGDVRVYVAAVAADGDGTAAGDRVYTLVATLQAVGACSLTKKPTLQTAVNGASFQAPFSSNAMITVFGLGFQVAGRTRKVGQGDISNNSFPTVLACVAVEVTGPGIAQPVRLPIAYVQQDQINAQAPAFSGAGPVNLTVILNPGKPNELRSDVAMLNAQAFAPAFFVFPGSMSVAAQFAGTGSIVANPAVVPGAKPAKPGDLITLYGTGFGDTSPRVPTGQLDAGVANLTNPVTVTIGGTALASADILYGGLSPSSISGLYQFNVRVPASAPDGDVPVSIAIGGVRTQDGTTIPIQH